MTYYQAGLGACGTYSNGDTDSIVALPAGLMGAQSNGNPYCGKTITIINGDVTTTATVCDKCPGCPDYSIDLSNKAFLATGEALSVGRKVIQWYFN
jgi:hypothetical protein